LSLRFESIGIYDKVEVVNTTEDRGSGIVLTQLTKSYGTVQAVRSIDLTIKKGEIVALLGPNGAGKTTTVRMLCCLISKASGAARIGDYGIGNEADSLKIRKMIGLVPDNLGLYEDLTAYDNQDYYGKLYECTAS
jgi:ABC-2 type transport system ATP-binding protein